MGKKMTVLRGVPGAQSVFGYKVLGRETDAGRVVTFWGRAREAAEAAQRPQSLGRGAVTQKRRVAPSGNPPFRLPEHTYMAVRPYTCAFRS